MQMAAEELDVPLDRVTVIQGDTALTPDQGPTYGSLSIQNGGVQIRQAAATAKKHLVELASQKLGVAADELIVEDGVIKPKSGGKGVGYGELVGSSSTSPRRPGADRRRGPQTNQRIAETLRDRAATTGTFKSDCRR
jgi:CO/xanthine dehydrogenase Mo-binding subunit